MKRNYYRDFIPYPCTRCDKMPTCPVVPQSYRPPSACDEYPSRRRNKIGGGTRGRQPKRKPQEVPALSPPAAAPFPLEVSAAGAALSMDGAVAVDYRTDRAGMCIFVGPAWPVLAGQPVADALGLGWLDPIHPEDRARVDMAFHHAVANRAPFLIRYRLPGQGGRWIEVVSDGRPQFGARGRYAGMTGVVMLATEQAITATS